MWILAINTATDAPSVGVLSIGDGAPALRTGIELLADPPPGRSGHSERLMPLIDEAVRMAGLKPAELEGVAVVAGPGGFTGVRTGLAAAKSIAHALGIPIWGIDTLDALAAGYPAAGLVAALLDARRGSVFARLYRDGEALDEPRLIELEEFLAHLPAGEPIAFLGEGAMRHAERLARHPLAIAVPAEAHAIRPATIARLAAPHLVQGGEDPLTLLPRYLRAPTMAPDWVPGNVARGTR